MTNGDLETCCEAPLPAEQLPNYLPWIAIGIGMFALGITLMKGDRK